MTIGNKVNSNQQAIVSVVTPVYNEESYLGECIESVLAQTYKNWDYTIIDNRSTDRTLDIARKYAAQDSRIRVHSNETFIRAVENQNVAFRHISPESKYCKLVFGDDWLFPECLERMVTVAEEHPNVAIVGAYGYGFHGTGVVWDGLPYHSPVVPGRDLCRASLLGGPYVFGTATSLLFRSDIVRSREAFYNESNLHADSEACFELLEHHDFGFVHQVLTFSRVKPDSLTSFSKRFNTYLPDRLYILMKHGPKYLTTDELKHQIDESFRDYYNYLGIEVFKRRDRKFWSFHRKKLAMLGYPLSTARLVAYAVYSAMDVVLNPKRSADAAVRKLTRWYRSVRVSSR
jgi:glycosyltransferase involved in cell wall biosynthesis